MKFRDSELILSCAFRYALGRMTYIVGEVVDTILDNWDELSPATKERFIKEIGEARDSNGRIGMDMDTAEWDRIIYRYNNEPR